MSGGEGAVRAGLATVRERIARACERVDRDPASVRLCVATKYVGIDDMAALADAGVELVGENRLQDLAAKQELFADCFEWHFIGHLQSRKTAEVAGRVAMIHSVASSSVVERLAGAAGALPKLLVQINISREPSKDGVAIDQLDDFLARLPEPAVGLMTMPPAADSAETVRPYFRRLAELAAERGLRELSIGTSQDFEVAIEEGATIVRVGAAVFAA